MLQSTCAFKNASHKVDEIRKKIQSNFQGDVPLRFKRLSKDYRGTPDAKRGLNFGGPGSSSDQNELQGKASNVHAIPVASHGHAFQNTRRPAVRNSHMH